MTADLLRTAATKMRALAEAATPGPWAAGERCVWNDIPVGRFDGKVVIDDGDAGDGGCEAPADAAYIAAMSPPVALAVADWLEAVAARYEALLDTFAPGSKAGARTSAENVTGWTEALAVARAFLTT